MTTNTKPGLQRLASAGFIGPREALGRGAERCVSCAHSGEQAACGKLRCYAHRAFVAQHGRCTVWLSVKQAGVRT